MVRKHFLNAVPLGRGLTIAIDIDGTVADSARVDLGKVDRSPDEFWKATPRKGVVEAVRKLYKQGHTIVFYTCRNNGSKNITKQWLMKYRFPFHHLVMNKFVAHVYIDDRAVNGCCWKDVMKNINKPRLPDRIARDKGMI